MRRGSPRSILLATGLLGALLLATPSRADRPKVWIYSDMSDPSLVGGGHMGTVNDPDDVSAMAGYLLMANEFETLGIVVASTHRKEHRDTPDQGEWANRYLGQAYRSEVPALNQLLGGYPEEIRFVQSCLKETSERFDPGKDYSNLKGYPTVKLLLDAVERLEPHEILNILCWGSLTEPAIAVKHCLLSGRDALLSRMRFISHWTDSSLHQGSPSHPEDVANCREDAQACAWLKQQALRGVIHFHECGAIGQAGIVSGGPKGRTYFDAFRVSRLGTAFVQGKFVFNGVDHSDSATYWVLLGRWGVQVEDLPADGRNTPELEKAHEIRFRQSSRSIHDELLSRARAAAGVPKVQAGDGLETFSLPPTPTGQAAQGNPNKLP